MNKPAGSRRVRWFGAIALVVSGLVASEASRLAAEMPHRPQEPLLVEESPVLVIGGGADREEYLFGSVGHAFLLEDGRVVVSDRGLGEIRVFGPDGTFLNRIGGKGEGPGEFEHLSGVWPTSRGSIGVWDRENVRISTFQPDGTLASEERALVERLQEMSGSPEVVLGAFRNDDILLALPQFGGPPSTSGEIPDRWILGRFGLDGVPRGLMPELRGFRRLGGSPVPFTPVPSVAVVADSLYVTDDYASEIRVFGDDDAPHRTIELPSVEHSARAAWLALERELRERGDGLYLNLMERLAPPEEFPQIAGLLVDGTGLIWAKIYDPSADALWLADAMLPGPGGEWWILRPTGELLSTVQIPDGVVPLQVTEDRLLGVHRDALDVERIVLHRIERSARQAARSPHYTSRPGGDREARKRIVRDWR